MAIQFTQFMFPNGNRKPVELDSDETTEKLARELQEAGWRFEIECFPDTQLVHGDCCNEDGQFASFAVKNGPEVPPAVVAMVGQAWARWVELGKPRADKPAVFEDLAVILIVDDPIHPEREPG